MGGVGGNGDPGGEGRWRGDPTEVKEGAHEKDRAGLQAGAQVRGPCGPDPLVQGVQLQALIAGVSVQGSVGDACWGATYPGDLVTRV